MKKPILVSMAAVALFLCQALSAAAMHEGILQNTENSLIKTGGVAADSNALSQKKYLFIYFSAHWCPPCRAFTPKLVDFYNKNYENGDFDLLFVSSDNDQNGMDKYMSETKMPWTGLKLKSARTEALEKQFGVDGIPCLVLLDENDKVVASSYVGKRYVGPGEALEYYQGSHKATPAKTKQAGNKPAEAKPKTTEARIAPKPTPEKIKGAKVSASTNSTDRSIVIGGKVITPATSPTDNAIVIGGKKAADKMASTP